ncbi:uncharacterized protein isoform X2 [Bombus fervidus]|uniref:uncharacterized protein isoform X2 n=1 Tax=Bombus fervidus TaxID=203811 RepID=UPI003D18DAE8
MTQLLNMVSDIRIGGPLLHGGLFNYGATLNKRELVSINMCYLAEERFILSWKLPEHILLHAPQLAYIHKPSTINLLKQQWCNSRHQVSAPRFADVLIEVSFYI